MGFEAFQMKAPVSRLVLLLAVVRLFWLPDLGAQDFITGKLASGKTVPGTYGGRIVVSLRSEPKTLNPIVSLDQSSREVISQMTGDLIHINRLSQQTEPALAKAWQISPDGRRYTLHLRQGVRFSDGHPLDADDVVFSFNAYLDKSINASQRDMLIVDGKPIAVRRVNSSTVEFEITEPYAAAERLFDSVAILPRHLLEDSYKKGKLQETWNLGGSPQNIAGLGPFRLKQYIAGQQITLERNPYYWKVDAQGRRLPYLDEITFVFVPSSDAEVIRFEAGDTDIVNRLSTDDYSVLEREKNSTSFQLYDAGPSLEFNFLFFNLNETVPPTSDVVGKQTWFRNVSFRQAVSHAIDRNALVHLVYQGRGTPLWTPVTEANSFWADTAIPHPARSLPEARRLLVAAGFSWSNDGILRDAQNKPVEFSILTSASNAQRTQMATMIQADLNELGIRVQVIPLEFRSLLDRVFRTHDYEAVIFGLGGGDVDPNSQMNVWLSSGTDHLWNMGETQPATAWETEIDRLMKAQVSTLTPVKRKLLYDKVQQIISEQLPIICLASPNILVGASRDLANFRPAVLDPHTLWNSEELFFLRKESKRQP